jgi:ketosteroid isomerase-like protein
MLNQELIDHFYNSFQKKDAEAMIACYHDEIEFSDPAFGTLKGIEAKSMWHMLIERGKDSLKIDYSNFSADSETGKATWVAQYEFSKTKRHVTNHVLALFEFKDGKIFRHKDSFDLKVWAKQALGPISMLLILTGQLEKTIQKQSRQALKSYMDNHLS